MTNSPRLQADTYRIAGPIKRVMQLFREALDERLRPYGITSAQLKVLAVLDREPGTSGAKLARICMVTPQTTQSLISAVEANGWVVRKPHPENGRILLATLTREGAAMLARSRRAVGVVHRRMLRDLSAEEIDLLESLLWRCAASLGALPSEFSTRRGFSALRTSASRLV